MGEVLEEMHAHACGYLLWYLRLKKIAFIQALFVIYGIEVVE
jgi:hypothetical protein